MFNFDSDTSFIIIAALRYCFGRRSYAPDLVTNWIKSNWSYIDKNTKHTIKKDINYEIETYERLKEINGDSTYLGDSCDIDTWIDFNNWVNDNLI